MSMSDRIFNSFNLQVCRKECLLVPVAPSDTEGYRRELRECAKLPNIIQHENDRKQYIPDLVNRNPVLPVWVVPCRPDPSKERPVLSGNQPFTRDYLD
jgi:hypothetical protein